MTTGDELSIALELYSDLEPPYPCWMEGRNSDAGPSYCWPCAIPELVKGRGEYIGRGCSPDESDVPEQCYTCGKLLDYTLTDYGFERELEQYRYQRLESPLPPSDAFYIARIIGAAPTDRRALRLARRALNLTQRKTP